MQLVSTRDKNQKVDLSIALLNPSANFGGLFSPINLPKFDEKFWSECENLIYKEIALKVIKSFEFDIEDEIFENALKRYERFDDKNCPVNFTKFGQNSYILELYHGPTLAFKDMALQPFGAILSSLAKKQNKNYLIMCATSGDTGPATLETFGDAENIKVVCLYPAGGTSEIQRLQMVNVKAKNLKTIGIKGNFDDAQRALKTLLASDEFKDELAKNNLSLSAANSVNFGRILFQIIYYIYANVYFAKNGLLKEKFDVIVPSGNFGNALGAYYAKKMGAKIGKIKIASNSNNILTELFTTGIYDLRNKTLINTMSPAMDILISSNVERLLFDKFGDIRTKELMQSLNENKFYKLTKDELALLQAEFVADFCDDEKCAKFIKNASDKGILIDPHTAICFKLVDENSLNLVVSTAKWVKFTPSMAKAIKGKMEKSEKDEMEALADEFKSPVPASVARLFETEEIHKTIVEQNEIKNEIIAWIKK